jgi:hypothetical protein
MKKIPNECIGSLVGWFGYHQGIAIKTGKKLTRSQMDLAITIGCNQPDKIRILFVSEMPEVKSQMLRKVMDQAGFNFGDAYGLCLGYGIYILKGGKGDSRVLAHELTHTLQFERLKSARAFLLTYVNQYILFGYKDMPLEKEARTNEKLGPRMLDR